MNSGWRLSIVLPLAILTMTLAAIVVSFMAGILVEKKEHLDHTKSTAQGMAAQLANLAEHNLESDPRMLAEATAMLATDPLVRLAAVITPEHQVRYSTMRALQGRPVSEVDGYSKVLFDRAREQNLILIESAEDDLSFIVLKSYTAVGRDDRIRSQSRGVIYLSYDLSSGMYQLLLQTVEQMLPGVIALFVISLILGVFLNNFMTVPLRQVGNAILAIESGDYSVRLESVGPREIRLLVNRFNQMSAQLGVMKGALDFQAERMRLVIEGVDDGIWDWNILTKDDYLSPRWKEIVGYRDDELPNVESTFFDLICQDDKAAVAEAVRRHLEESEPFFIEFRLKHKDGSDRWVLSRGEAVRDPDGRPVRMLGSITDITERKRIEDVLRKSEQRLANGQRLSRLGSWELDLVDNKLIWTDEVYRIFGLQRDEFDASYEAFLEVVHPDDRDLVSSAYRQSLKNKMPYDLVHRLLLKDGTMKYVNEKCETFYDVDGTAVRSIGTVQDITERMLVEDKLRLLAAVVENTAEGVLITDVDNNIVAMNHAFTEITGYTEDEALGKNPRILKSEQHDRDFYRALWVSIESEGVWQGEIWDRRKNGEIFATWQTISIVRDNDDNIVNYVSVFSDISAIKHSQAQLNYMAHHDPLTDLPNRLLFNDRLGHAIQRAQRDAQQMAILFLDLDHFKNINDSLGHPVGDDLLQQVAARITHLLREEDTIARLGGDEFIILVEKVYEAQDMAQLATKIVERFNKPFVVTGHELHLTVSIGISLFPQDGNDGAVLVKNADAAMYRAKREGRNNYQFYTAALTVEVLERLTLETALRHALENDELVLHYQPQHLLKTGQLTGVEALVRWQHSDFGLIPPMKFIPLAEESGLIVPIGEWVLRSACQQMQCWLDAGYPLERIAVNLSSIQFQRGDVVATVKDVLKETGLSPRRLELEITEGLVIQDTERTINSLNKLKDVGVTMAIDDFGTGYSSLSYLKQLPVEKLKIDRSFVKDILDDPNDEAITRAVIALGKNLQLKVIAEGMETEAQQAFLKSLGCHEGQGYLYSRPVPEEELVKLLRVT